MKSIEELGTVVSTDVLVIGGGGAGLCAAIKAKESPVDVLVVDKGGIGWAGQVPLGGGETAYVYPDQLEAFCRKVAEATNHFNNQDWTYQFAQGLTKIHLELEALGVPFLKTNGEILIHKIGEDSYVTRMNPLEAMLKLKSAAVARGVNTLDKINVIDLLQKDGRVVGAIGLGLVDGKTYVFNAKAVIIANGSCRFQSMKEMNWNLGEGMTMAFQAGAQVANAEFRSFYIGSAKQLAGKELMGIDPSFFPLYMENALGERIMEKHYPELVVGKKPGETRGDISLLNDVMFREAEAGYGPIYFDIGKLNLPPEDMKRLKARPRLGFPPLYAWDSLRLLKDKLGIDPDKEKIEIAPVFGGGQGSIRINLDCGTTVEGLWAIGDAASLGSGFAAPSLMAGGFGIGFAAVSGFIAGQSTGEYAAGNKRLEIETGEAERVKARAFAPLGRGGDVAVADVMHQVHEAVVPMKYNFKREAGRLKEALGIIQKAKENLSRVGARDYHELARYHQAESMALAGELTYKAALMREETRGQHRREDFPDRDDKNWLKWIVIEQKDGEPYLSTEPVPSAK